MKRRRTRNAPPEVATEASPEPRRAATAPPPQAARVSGTAWAVAVGVALFAFLLMIKSAGFGYVFDDHVELETTTLNFTWSEVPAYFSRGLSGLYRPLRAVSHVIDHGIWGRGARGGHIANCLIHALNAALVFMLMLKWQTTLRGKASLVAAALGAVLFAAHPLAVSAVGWVSARAVLLATCFALGSLVAFPEWRRFSWPRAALSAALFGAALFSWEGLVFLPLWIAMTALLESPKPDWKRLFAPLAMFAGVAALYFLMRHSALGSVLATEQARQSGVGERLLRIVPVLTEYLKLIAAPVEQSVDYRIPPIQVLGAWFLGSVAAICALGFAGWRAFLRPAPFGFALALVATSLIPVFTIDAPLADRYAYPALVAVALLVACAWEGEWRALWVKPALRVGVCASVVVLAVVGRGRLDRWKDDGALFAASVKHPLASDKCFNNHAGVLEVAGDKAGAYAAYKRAVEVEPRNNLAWTNLGNQALHEGKFEDALALYDKALSIDENYHLTHLNRGAALSRLKRDAESREAYERTIRIQPNYALAHYSLGLNHFKNQRPDEAKASLTRFLELAERDPSAKQYTENAKRLISQLDKK